MCGFIVTLCIHPLLSRVTILQSLFFNAPDSVRKLSTLSQPVWVFVLVCLPFWTHCAPQRVPSNFVSNPTSKSMSCTCSQTCHVPFFTIEKHKRQMLVFSISHDLVNITHHKPVNCPRVIAGSIERLPTHCFVSRRHLLDTI